MRKEKRSSFARALLEFERLEFKKKEDRSIDRNREGKISLNILLITLCLSLPLSMTREQRVGVWRKKKTLGGRGETVPGKILKKVMKLYIFPRIRFAKLLPFHCLKFGSFRAIYSSFCAVGWWKENIWLVADIAAELYYMQTAEKERMKRKCIFFLQ